MIISFEGIDGCGKSTQEKLLAKYLADSGYTIRRIREPGGTPVSERIRDILLDRESDIDPFAEMLLFSAARAQLSRTLLADWNAKGDIILCDRFFDSTIAYQGGARGVADPEWLYNFQREVTGGLVPDRTYYLKVDAGSAEIRKAGRGGPELDRMESEGPDFFRKVIDTYDTLARREPERFFVVDATRDVESIFDLIRSDAELLLRRRTAAGTTELRHPSDGRPDV